jgi:hypothetical protein
MGQIDLTNFSVGTVGASPVRQEVALKAREGTTVLALIRKAFVAGLTVFFSTILLCRYGHTQPVAKEWPRAFQGVWFGGSSCDDATSYLYTSREYEINGSLVADIEGKFTLSLITADVIQSAEAEKTIRTLSRVNPDTGQRENRKLVSRISGDVRTDEFSPGWNGQMSVVSFRHCLTPYNKRHSTPVYNAFYKGLSVAADNYNRLQETCTRAEGGSYDECAAVIVGILDVNKDGKIAPAEITKFLRDTAKYVVFFNMKPSANDPNVFVGSFALDEVRASQAAATIVAPLISNMLMANLDYDGNGFLTADEIGITLKGEGGVTTSDLGSVFGGARSRLNDLVLAITGLRQLLGAGAGGHR